MRLLYTRDREKDGENPWDQTVLPVTLRIASGEDISRGSMISFESARWVLLFVEGIDPDAGSESTHYMWKQKAKRFSNAMLAAVRVDCLDNLLDKLHQDGLAGTWLASQHVRPPRERHDPEDCTTQVFHMLDYVRGWLGYEFARLVLAGEITVFDFPPGMLAPTMKALCEQLDADA